MSELPIPIPIPREEIAAFCRRNHIRKLSLFGSVLRDDFQPESDVDVLVEFEEGRRIGLAFFGLQYELEEMFGRRADVFTPGFLSRYIRNEVERTARVIYDAAESRAA